MIKYYSFLTKQTNGKYIQMICHTCNDIDNLKRYLLSNRNDCEVREIIHIEEITEDRYNDMSKTYIIRDLGDMDIVHIDNPYLQYEFIDKIIKKHVKHQFDYSYRGTHNYKQHIYTRALENYPIHNPTMLYYLKCFFEKSFQCVFPDNIEFKITKFGIETYYKFEDANYHYDELNCGCGNKVYLELIHRKNGEDYQTYFLNFKSVQGGNGIIEIEMCDIDNYDENKLNNMYQYVNNDYKSETSIFLRGENDDCYKNSDGDEFVRLHNYGEVNKNDIMDELENILTVEMSANGFLIDENGTTIFASNEYEFS